MVDAEPSRFLEELDDKYIQIISRPRTVNSGDLSDIFDMPTFTNQRTSKKNFTYKKVTKPQIVKSKSLFVPKNLKKVDNKSLEKSNLFDSKISVGSIVEHARFGRGEVKHLEGIGANIKAEINFEKEGIKKLLLKFAKLKIIA